MRRVRTTELSECHSCKCSHSKLLSIRYHVGRSSFHWKPRLQRSTTVRTIKSRYWGGKDGFSLPMGVSVTAMRRRGRQVLPIFQYATLRTSVVGQSGRLPWSGRKQIRERQTDCTSASQLKWHSRLASASFSRSGLTLILLIVARLCNAKATTAVRGAS